MRSYWISDLHKSCIFFCQGFWKAKLWDDIWDIISCHVLDGLEDALDVVVLTPGRPELQRFARGLFTDLVQIVSQPTAQLLTHNLSVGIKYKISPQLFLLKLINARNLFHKGFCSYSTDNPSTYLESQCPLFFTKNPTLETLTKASRNCVGGWWNKVQRGIFFQTPVLFSLVSFKNPRLST